MTEASLTTPSRSATRRATHIVDCDVHQTLRSRDELKPYLPEYFRNINFGDGAGSPWASPIGVNRKDAIPPEGGPAGSSPAHLVKHHVEAFGIDHAILTGDATVALGVHPHADYAAAVATAYNNWLVDHWLDTDKRLWGCVAVSPQNPQAAAAEIRRIGAHPRMVQVIMCSATRIPLGQRYYWPIYEAACEMNLPVAVHPGMETKGISNGFVAGMPSTYLEWHTNLPQNYMGQITSLVLEGVFEAFESLMFVAIEGGIAWLPHLMWRMDKNWKALRVLAPSLKRLPSEYIIDHVRLTTQPIEEPANPDHLLAIFEMIHAERTVMFSSDYPHWDNDSPTHAFPKLPAELADRIFWRTATELYGLPNAKKVEGAEG